MPEVLAYASAAHNPWRPILFALSRRTLILALLTAAAVTWLTLRHDPWRLVATIPSDYKDSPFDGAQTNATFTSEGHVLLFDTKLGANRYDPATGKFVRNVLPTLDIGAYVYYHVMQGRQILALPQKGAPVRLYDGFTGQLIREYKIDHLSRSDILAVSPGSACFITRDHLDTRFGCIITLRPDGQVRRDHLQISPSDIQFSPDGTRFVAKREVNNYPVWHLFDGSAGTVVTSGLSSDLYARMTFSHSGVLATVDFNQPLPTTRSTGWSVYMRLFDWRTGAEIKRIDLTWSGFAALGRLFLSPDARFVGLPQFPPGQTGMAIMQTDTGRIFTYDEAPFVPLSHRSNRFIAGHNATRQFAAYYIGTKQPLAILSPPRSTTINNLPAISPDDRSIAIGHSSSGPHSFVALYHRAAFDCPPSRFGILAFPQTWLTILFFAAFTISLAQDARRSRWPVARPLPALLTIPLLFTTAALTLFFILTAAIDRWTLNPGPLLFIPAVALFTGSRFWRFITLPALAGALSWCMYLATRTGKLSGPQLLPILDRHYGIPATLPLLSLITAAALCAAAIALLAKRPRDLAQ